MSHSHPLKKPLRQRAMLAVAAGLAALTASSVVYAQDMPKLPPLPEIWHQVEQIPLWPKGTPTKGFKKQSVPADWPDILERNIDKPVLRVFRAEKSNGRALLAIPGGAYTFVSVLNEGIDVAAKMNAHGYTVFVLNYRLPDEGWAGREDVPLQDVQRAMRMIRANADKYGIDPKSVSAVGFSAGGHLGATLATAYAEPAYAPRDNVDAQDARPAAIGLVYPVIEAKAPNTHAGSAQRLLGNDPSEELIKKRSPAEHVTEDTPPLFIVHSIDDSAVPVENSLIMMRAMQAAKRPVEVHLFETGGHAYGAGWKGQPTEQWTDLFATWLETKLK
jgi:acetyl esterase/lipase